MTDAAKLRVLADWLDARDQFTLDLLSHSDEVQQDLRRIADRLESLEDHEHPRTAPHYVRDR